MSIVSGSTAFQQLPVCPDPRAFPAEQLPGLDPLQRALPSQVQHLASVLDEFRKVPIVHSCSLFRSIWTGCRNVKALCLSIAVAAHNLVPSADLLNMHSITSLRSQVHPICFVQLLQRRIPFSSHYKWCGWHCLSNICCRASVCLRDEFFRVIVELIELMWDICATSLCLLSQQD